MSDFRDYEVIQQLWVEIRSEGVRARKPGSKREVLLKALKLDELSHGHSALEETRIVAFKELAGDPRLEYEAAIKAQSAAGRAKDSNVAPIYDFFQTDEGVCFATDFYRNGSLKRKIQLAVPNHPALQHVIGGILRGLLSLKTISKRGHGNLHPNNVMLAGGPKTPLRECGIFLADVAPITSKSPPDLEAEDIRSVGQILYQLVMRKVEDRKDEFPFPVRSSPEWEALGDKGEFWLGLCNRMLGPELAPGAETIEGLLREIGSPPSKKPIAIVAGVVAVAAVVAAGIFLIPHHGQPAPTKPEPTPPAPQQPPPAPEPIKPEPTPPKVEPTPPPNQPTTPTPTPEPTPAKPEPTPPKVEAPPPVPVISFASTNPAGRIVTFGQPITWQFTVQNASGPVTAQPLNQVLTPAPDGTYRLPYTPQFGDHTGPTNFAISYGSNLTANLPFEIVAPPPPRLSIGGPTSVEAGTSMTWTVSLDAGFSPGAPLYTITSANPDLIPDQNLTPSLTANGNGKYTLTVTAKTTEGTHGSGNLALEAHVQGGESAKANLPFEITAIPLPTLELTTPNPLVMAPGDNSIILRFKLEDKKVSPENLGFSLANQPDILDQTTQTNGAERIVTLARRAGKSGQVAMTATVTAGGRTSQLNANLEVQAIRKPALDFLGSKAANLDVNAPDETARIQCQVQEEMKPSFEISPPHSPLLSQAAFELDGNDPSKGYIVLKPNRGYVGEVHVTVRATALDSLSTTNELTLTVTGDVAPPTISSSNAITLEKDGTESISVTLNDKYFPATTLTWKPEIAGQGGGVVAVGQDVDKGVANITGKAEGKATVELIVAAPNGRQGTNSVNVNVLAAEPPQIVMPNGPFTYPKDVPLNIQISDNVTPPGQIALVLTAAPAAANWNTKTVVLGNNVQLSVNLTGPPSPDAANQSFQLTATDLCGHVKVMPFEITFAKPSSYYTNTATGMEFAWVPNLPETGNAPWSDGKSGGGWVGRCEVTQGQFEGLMGTNPSKFKLGPKYPVESMSLEDATKFCKALTKKDNLPQGWRYVLPSETQWKFLSKGAEPNHQYANYFAKSTIEVGTLLTNSFGLYDVFGNVSELTSSTSVQNGMTCQIVKGGNWDESTTPMRENGLNDYYFKPDPKYGFRVILIPVAKQ